VRRRPHKGEGEKGEGGRGTRGGGEGRKRGRETLSIPHIPLIPTQMLTIFLFDIPFYP